MHLAAGLSVGLAGVAAGYAIGIVGDAVRFPMTSSSMPLLVLTADGGCAGIHATIARLRGHDLNFDLW